MQKVEQVTGTAVPLLLDDIDTDRIIPARFLRCVTFEGIGEHAFEDDRQQNPAHPFNDSRFRDAHILIAGRNFGCGSSREHAPQSLLRWGIQAIIAESYAEIFFGNCIALGMVPVTASRVDLERLVAAVELAHDLLLRVDLRNQVIEFGGRSVPCRMPDSPREALLKGEWDFLGQLLENREAIYAKRQQLPCLASFRA